VSLPSTGTYTLEATSFSTGATGAYTLTLEAAAATLSVTGITDPITAGTSSDVTVTALDSFGNVATGYTGTVAFTFADDRTTTNKWATVGVTAQSFGAITPDDLWA